MISITGLQVIVTGSEVMTILLSFKKPQMNSLGLLSPGSLPVGFMSLLNKWNSKGRDWAKGWIIYI